MLSRDDAYTFLEASAAELKSLSYGDLERLAKLHRSADEWESRELQIDGETVYISTTFTKFGRFRKRVGVEMVLTVKGDDKRSRVPFIYFERFESGRFYPSPRQEAREAALLKTLPYAFLGGVVIGLLALVWHLFL